MPDEWFVFSCEELATVCPTSEEHLLGIDLIRYVDQKYVEVVVGVVIWLEYNLDRVVSVGFNCATRRHQEEGFLP